MIFDDFVRTDSEFATYSEGNFAFLNRSGRPEFAAVRELIEEWFGRYPVKQQPALRSRLRSRTQHQFDSAFFELYLHELLSRLGFKVEVEPPAPSGRARCPDFLATAPDGREVFLEAVVVSDQSQPQEAAQRRMDELLNGLNELESPNYFLSIRHEGSPASPVPRRRWKEEVRRFLATLEGIEPPPIAAGFDAFASVDLEHDGWSVRVMAVPKQRSKGKPGGRPVGSHGSGARMVDLRTPLRDAVAFKATRYGDLGRPYVVAANCHPFHTGRDDIMGALFGQEQVVFEPEHRAGEVTRSPDGAWTSRGGPRNTRVSAAMVAATIFPWSVAAVVPTIYHNPYAAHRCEDINWNLPAARPCKGQMDFSDGPSGADIFGLPNDWPHCFATNGEA